MDFDYTDFEYLPVCVDGCNAITGWLASKKVARDAARNHELEKGHHWELRERKKGASV